MKENMSTLKKFAIEHWDRGLDEGNEFHFGPGCNVHYPYLDDYDENGNRYFLIKYAPMNTLPHHIIFTLQPWVYIKPEITKKWKTKDYNKKFFEKYGDEVDWCTEYLLNDQIPIMLFDEKHNVYVPYTVDFMFDPSVLFIDDVEQGFSDYAEYFYHFLYKQNRFQYFSNAGKYEHAHNRPLPIAGEHAEIFNNYYDLYLQFRFPDLFLN